MKRVIENSPRRRDVWHGVRERKLQNYCILSRCSILSRRSSKLRCLTMAARKVLINERLVLAAFLLRFLLK